MYDRRTANRSTSLNDSLQVHVGFESESHERLYYWDGMKRGADETHPFMIFQYTLDGWGSFYDGSREHRIEAGTAFTALVPSTQVYYLPKLSRSWTFFWVIFYHPYIVERLRASQNIAGSLLTIGETDALLTRTLYLFEGICQNTFRDQWAIEQSLFDFLFEYERLAQRQKYPSDRRDDLLERVKRVVLNRAGDPITVSAIADSFTMSRSHFSHMFKEHTGVAPAAYIRQICFEEATRRLLETDDKLESVALATGFANANHLCKVFRKRYHLSPGSFRKQLR